MTKFNHDWEPTLVEREVIARGRWWYDGEIEHRAELVRERWDYTERELEEHEDEIHPETFMDLQWVNGEGECFFWRFAGPLAGRGGGYPFTSLAEARDRLAAFGRHEIDWESDVCVAARNARATDQPSEGIEDVGRSDGPDTA